MVDDVSTDDTPKYLRIARASAGPLPLSCGQQGQGRSAAYRLRCGAQSVRTLWSKTPTSSKTREATDVCSGPCSTTARTLFTALGRVRRTAGATGSRRAPLFFHCRFADRTMGFHLTHVDGSPQGTSAAHRRLTSISSYDIPARLGCDPRPPQRGSTFTRQHARNLMTLVSAPSVVEKSTHSSVPRRQAFLWARRKRVRA